jgi:hypothetical protein
MIKTRLRALRDRYLPVLALCLLFAAGAQGQVYTGVASLPNYTAGFRASRTLGVPSDTVGLSFNEKTWPQLAVKNGVPYIWSVAAQRWIASSSNTDSLVSYATLRDSAAAIRGAVPTLSSILAISGNANGYSITNLTLVSATNVEGPFGVIGNRFFIKDYSTGKYLQLAPVASGISADATVYIPQAPGDTLATKAEVRGATATPYFPLGGGTITGTAGAGYIGFPSQSSQPTTPVSGYKLYASSAGAFAWVTFAGYQRELRVRAQTQNNIWYLQDKGTQTLADSADVAAQKIRVDTLMNRNALQTLTDGATITWNVNSGYEGQVTIAGTRTLSITNLPTDGKVYYGSIAITQDATGSRDIIVPTNSKGVNGMGLSTSQTINLTDTGGAIDILCFKWNGTTLFWTIGKNYN